MAKWVSLLLVVLALLVYGLSQMRPEPQEASASHTPSSTGATPVEFPDAPPETTSGTAPRTMNSGVKAPNFGPVPGSEAAAATANPTPGGNSATKVASSDPFSKTSANVPKVDGKIKATIFSETPSGGARTLFSPATESIYLTATPEGLDDKVELVAEYRSVRDENEGFSAPVESSGPPRRRVFRLTPPKTGWVPGPYQVIFKVKDGDQVVTVERFEIADPKTKIPDSMPQPEYLDLVPDLEAMEHHTSFQSNDGKILLRVSAPELPPGTPIRTVWSAVEADKLTSGELIAVSSQSAPVPGRDAVFTYEAPPRGFHPGTYQVEVYFDQVPAGSQAFFIEPAGKPDGQR